MYESLLGLTATILFATAAQATSTGHETMLVAEGAAPAATLTLDGGTAAGAGYVWEHGLLEYHDRQSSFKLDGISVIDVGSGDVTAAGEVYNLSQLSDFNGNYVAVAAGGTQGSRASVSYLMNQHGVIIKLHSTTVGLRFTFSADGAHIHLQGS